MSQLIDRRQHGSKKSIVNRQRFLRRYKSQIKRAVSDAVGKRSITEIEKGEQVTIPAKDISEPHFHSGQGGYIERVLPGNEKFISGDRIKKENPEEGSGSGSQASADGEDQDNFVFELSREEFLDLYFEDLELPDLVKKQLAGINTFKTIRAGVSTSGVPNNINVLRSMKQATGRRVALASPYKKQLKEAEKELASLRSGSSLIEPATAENFDLTSSHPSFGHLPPQVGKGKSKKVVRGRLLSTSGEKGAEEDILIEALEKKIELLKRKILNLPFIDTIDLRYNNRIRVPQPSTQAIMFCVMDVSGSMDETKKEVAKRFFILLYLFLTKNYRRIELVFIRHHTSAKEVGEEEFFYSRETGGTVVSSALELLRQIIEARYPPNAWNIYVAQASDGDNWNADSPYCQTLLQERIMPLLQYFAYIEIMPRHHQSLWEVYQQVKASFPNFAMENIDQVADIYPVFRELFKRKNS